jgi:lipoprotein-anchoring transpeptidase ErfK/SrfK
VQRGQALANQGKLVDARKILSAAVLSGSLNASDDRLAREVLTQISARLVFSPEIAANDPFVSTYVVQGGDKLATIVRDQKLAIDWRFLARINRIARPESVQSGQKIKQIRGPFHAIVDKHAFRLDLLLGDGGEQVLVASYPVGLGEYDSTPPGKYRIRPRSKLVDPQWTNPRTGEFFASGDPRNPIGEYWLGLIGAEERTRDIVGYGLHGTIDPESIGSQRSMGCIRMLPQDIELIYQVLTEDVSTVEIR